MTNKFLNAKHWQLFSLIFGIPLIFQIVMMLIMFASMSSEASTNPTEIFNMFKFYPIIIIMYMGVYFGWFWSIAIGLQKKVPKNISMKTKKFKLFFFLPVIYIFCISLFISVTFSGIMEGEIKPNNGLISAMIGIILPFHLLSMFGIFYTLYFTAKTLKTVELQKEVGFGDFIGEFFMLWFYFIGIWILQPKINKIAENTTNSDFT